MVNYSQIIAVIAFYFEHCSINILLTNIPSKMGVSQALGEQTLFGGTVPLDT